MAPFVQYKISWHVSIKQRLTIRKSTSATSKLVQRQNRNMLAGRRYSKTTENPEGVHLVRVRVCKSCAPPGSRGPIPARRTTAGER